MMTAPSDLLQNPHFLLNLNNKLDILNLLNFHYHLIYLNLLMKTSPVWSRLTQQHLLDPLALVLDPIGSCHVGTVSACWC